MKDLTSGNIYERIILWLALLAMIIASIGGHWDGWLHTVQGHTPTAMPHLIVGIGVLLFGVAGTLALYVLTRHVNSLQSAQRRGMWLVVVGGIGVPMAGLFDQAWHMLIGEDRTIWSVPHLSLLFFATVIFLGCALTVVTRRSHVQFTWFKFSDWLAALFFGVMLIPLFVSLAEYDQPIRSWMASVRPGYEYPLVTSLATTFLLILASSIMRRVGAITLVALGAYVLYSGLGYVISGATEYYHILPSFPIMVPALALDIWLYFSWKTQKAFVFSLRTYLISSVLTITICYWAVIAWAVFYTHDQLPQQLSGSMENWIGSYGALLVMSVVVAIIARWVVYWSLGEDESRGPSLVP